MLDEIVIEWLGCADKIIINHICMFGRMFEDASSFCVQDVLRQPDKQNKETKEEISLHARERSFDQSQRCFRQRKPVIVIGMDPQLEPACALKKNLGLEAPLHNNGRPLCAGRSCGGKEIV